MHLDSFMLVYHQIRVGGKFLTDEGSISSNVQLKNRPKLHF